MRAGEVQTRATQSFVGTLSACWRRPAVTALEVGWRWLLGVPALLLVRSQVLRVLDAATSGTFDPAALGLDRVFLTDPVGAMSGDPVGATGKVAHASGLVLPGLEHAAAWLVPALLVAWVVVSALGRTLVLRRFDASLRPAPLTLMGLHAIRVVALTAVLLLWCRAAVAIGHAEVTGPLATGAEPNLIGYCALVIVISLGLFTAWGFVSWPLAVAPLLAMLNGTGVLASMRAALHLGALRGKLAEINLVLAVVKIALIVLAMVFSATPLPFQAVTSQGFLLVWWSGVAVLYLLWSDFFHVARLVGYLQLWRLAHPVCDPKE